MGFQLVAYEKLKVSINESIKAVLDKHKLDTTKVEESILRLDDPRRIHCQLLKKYVELLDSSGLDDKVKVLVLNGAVFYIRSQIEAEYQYRSKENSTLFNSLTTSLELTTDNQPNSHDLQVMYLNLSKFLHSKTYIDGEPGKGYTKDEPFSSKVIKTYSVETDLKNLVTVLYRLKISDIDEAAAAHAKAIGKQSKGLLGGLFGGGSAAALPKGGAESSLPVLK